MTLCVTFKVKSEVTFGKPTYDFLSVFNSKYRSSGYSFEIMAFSIYFCYLLPLGENFKQPLANRYRLDRVVLAGELIRVGLPTPRSARRSVETGQSIGPAVGAGPVFLFLLAARVNRSQDKDHLAFIELDFEHLDSPAIAERAEQDF